MCVGSPCRVVSIVSVLCPVKSCSVSSCYVYCSRTLLSFISVLACPFQPSLRGHLYLRLPYLVSTGTSQHHPDLCLSQAPSTHWLLSLISDNRWFSAWLWPPLCVCSWTLCILWTVLSAPTPTWHPLLHRPYPSGVRPRILWSDGYSVCFTKKVSCVWMCRFVCQVSPLRPMTQVADLVFVISRWSYSHII